MDLTEAQQHRLNQINELDEFCQSSIQQTDIIQCQRAKWHDQFIKKKKFVKGIGHSCLILDTNILREIFAYDGWDLMK
jgi:hypothetical protein